MRDIEANVLLAVLAVALVVAGWVGFSFFEARAFNAATDSDVSTWQAMFTSLRIQDAPVKPR